MNFSAEPPDDGAALPFPDLPAGQTLEPTELQDLPEIPDLGIDYGTNDDNSNGYKAIEFGKLTAANWLAIANNTNLSYGQSFKDASPGPSIHALIPKNRSLSQIFKPSQISTQYSSRVSFVSKQSDSLTISTRSATAKISKPFVSGSTTYSRRNEERAVMSSEMLSTSVVYQLPIGTLNFSAENWIDYEDTPKEEAVFQVNPKLVERFTACLDDFDNLKKGSTEGVNKFDLIDKVTTFFEDFGDVIARSATIGLASFKTGTVAGTEQQSLSKYNEKWKAAIDSTFAGKSGGSSGYEDAGTYKEADVKKIDSQNWKVFGGSTPRGNNPFRIVDDRRNPNSWRASEFSAWHSIVDLLPQHLQNRMKKYDDDIEFMSIFHNLEDNCKFQLQESWQQFPGSSTIKSMIERETQADQTRGFLSDKWFQGQACMDNFAQTKKAQFVFTKRPNSTPTQSYTIAMNWVTVPGETDHGQLRNKFLHSSSAGKPFTFRHIDNDKFTENELFIIVPYRPEKGAAPSAMKYAIRNVATRDYMHVNDPPTFHYDDKEGKVGTFWPM